MHYAITIRDTGECFPCTAGQTVLAAMERLGRKGIPIGCRGGGCGVCRVQIIGRPRYRTLKMSRVHVSSADLARGICLACKLVPEEDLTLETLAVMSRRPGHDAWGA